MSPSKLNVFAMILCVGLSVSCKDKNQQAPAANQTEREGQVAPVLEKEEASAKEEETEEEINLEDFVNDPVEQLTLDELNQRLQSSIENEDYEQASKIRDEIKRRSGKIRQK